MWRLGDGSGSRGPLGVVRPASSHPFPGTGSESGRPHTAGAGTDPDYIMQLVNDVRRFADVLLHLKEAFHSKENQDCLHGVVHDRLGELLRVLKAVIGKHQALNSVDVLGAAGSVIAKVKGVNFKDVNEENRKQTFADIHTSVDTLAFTFGNVVSDFLMGDVDSRSALGVPQTRRSRSFENLSVDSGGVVPEKDDLPGLPSVEDVDRALLSNDSGVESALLYAKAWSKYTKDLLAWVDKRLTMDIECAKGFAKMAESARALAVQQDYMPFKEIYVSAFNNDIEYSQLLLQTASALQANKFVQPLLARKNELDKLRKEVKEQWQKEQKKLQEASTALRKARALQAQRKEEYEKARSSTSRVEEEAPPAGGKQLEKKRRLEEEALQKAEDANEQYSACITDLSVKRKDMAQAKGEILTQVRELVFQCDLTLKAVTVNWFQMQQAQAVSLPVNHQALCESAKRYEPGRCYADFIQSLPRDRRRPDSTSSDGLGPHSAGAPFAKGSVSSVHSSHGNLSQMSVTSSDFQSTDEVDSPSRTRVAKVGVAERRSNSTSDIQALRPQGPLRGWSSGSQGGGMCSDSESAGGSSESRSMDSPTASPGDFKRRLPRTPSTGTMSSADDLDEREPPSPSDNGLGEMVTEATSSPGPFRNTQMSKAAQTHRLRKLRAPSKCRECDSLVVFHGAECEECSLACHKKCLETLAIQCGHKKLQGRLHLFGVDFVLAARNSPDGIPFIIKKCTSEIENRALNIKGIYRVNGAKSRVEKLCQAFENGKDLVELSDLYPHDISNVLKLYLRQLPEPLVLFRYYNDFIGLAKECQNLMDEVDAARSRSANDPAPLSVELNRVLFKIRDLLRQLPPAHYKTLQYLVGHLHRVTEKADENKMTASNLGIIFGPTLMKPRQTDAEVSLSSLVDYPYQALIVELLIRHFGKVFDVLLSPVSAVPPGREDSLPPLKGREARLSAEEKEARLSRHSRSLMDIKEQSTKVYKRHSSIIPSSHLVDEVKEEKPRLEESEFTPVVETASEKLNGLPPTGLQEMHRSTLVFGKPTVSTSRVQLRQPRAKFVSRPISMPVERLLGPAQVLERNSRNSAERERSPAPREAKEPEKQALRVNTYHRNTYIDTQTLRRTWDKQYKHYDITPLTAKIMANIPSDTGVGDSGNMPAPSAPTASSTTSALLPVTMFTMSGRPGKTLRRENNASEHVQAPAPGTFKPPRTLRPPPGTFYKPPPSQRPKPAGQEAPVSGEGVEAEPEVAQVAEAELGAGPVMGEPLDELMESESAVTPSQSQPQSPSSCPEDTGPTEAKPVYHRLRTRRLQEFEHREAHFV